MESVAPRGALFNVCPRIETRQHRRSQGTKLLNEILVDSKADLGKLDGFVKITHTRRNDINTTTAVGICTLYMRGGSYCLGDSIVT